MVIHAIQEDDAYGGLLERPCRRQAAESSPHDDDVRLCPLRLGFECFVHYASPISLAPDRRAPRYPPGVGQPRTLSVGVGIAPFLEHTDAAAPGAKDHHMRQCRPRLRFPVVIAQFWALRNYTLFHNGL